MTDPIPSPLINGQWPVNYEPGEDDAKQLARRCNSRGAIVFVTRHEDTPCGPECTGDHLSGAMHNINKQDAEMIVRFLMERFNIQDIDDSDDSDD